MIEHSLNQSHPRRGCSRTQLSAIYELILNPRSLGKYMIANPGQLFEEITTTRDWSLSTFVKPLERRFYSELLKADEALNSLFQL
jgi:hypothetical protein